VSVLVHAGLLAALWWPAKSLLDSGGGGGGIGPRGGGGGGGRSLSSVIALEAYAAPAQPEPEPEPEEPVPPIAVENIPTPEVMSLDELARIEVPHGATDALVPGAGAGTGGGPGSGTGTGGGSGSGSGTGVGTGQGPGSGGDDSYILLATPRGIILPPECVSPGSRFQVRFWVAADGRVTDVEIQPPPRDKSCRRDFEVRMRGYRFEPAKTREGAAVASIYPITIER